MKTLLRGFIVLALVLAHTWALAAGSCTQTIARVPTGENNPIVRTLTFVCTGDSSDGSIPSTAVSTTNMGQLYGMYLYTVVAYPTSGGTAPDAADVTITMSGQDLLGGKGTNLIHATATQDTFPYSTFMSMYRYPAVTNTLTLAVANQATNSANYTIRLVFVK